MKKGAEPSSTQKFIEEYRAWIVFLIVLPISFVVSTRYYITSCLFPLAQQCSEDVVEKTLNVIRREHDDVQKTRRRRAAPH